MAFIGNQPALSYTSFAVQHFTTSATTSYTLNYPVANENEIRLVINNVVQQPGSSYAYTASGTSLTLSAATTVSDTMYAVFLGKAVQTVNPPNGSVGLSQLSATGTPSSTTFLRGDNSWVAAGGTNTPNFWVYMTTNQTIPTSTFTTIQFNAELFDTANAFNTSTYTYTIPSTGKYFFGVNVRKENSRTDRNLTHLKVNGTTRRDFETGSYSNYGTSVGTTIESLSANDTITIQFYHDRGSNQDVRSGTDSSFFYGYKIIE